jgi:hypothetical protein
MFDESKFPVAVRADLLAALRQSWTEIGRAGTWWAGAERVAIASLARNERLQRKSPPWQREAAAELAADLPEVAAATAKRIAADAHNLDGDWAEAQIAELGDAPYVEIASIVVVVAATDAFCEAMGVELVPFPEPQRGEPSRVRPEGVGDIGAWVPAIVDFEGPNVARALSLVPDGLRSFFRLVSTMYSYDDFREMVWADRPLPRPAVELLAARVSALNQCFY